MAQKIDGGVYEVFLIRVFVAAICATLLAVAFSRATSFHGRWLQPLLVSIPVLAVSLVRRRLVPTRCNYMVIGGIVIAGALAAAIPGRIVLGARLGREEPLMRPYPELAAQLKKMLPERVLVVADRTLLAGNLRMGLPNVPIVTRETTHLVKSWRGEVVFVWPSKDSATMPPPLQRWALGAGFEWAPGDPQLLSARYKYDPEKSFALAFLKGRTRSAVGRE